MNDNVKLARIYEGRDSRGAYFKSSRNGEKYHYNTRVKGSKIRARNKAIKKTAKRVIRRRRRF
jgi:hypothetical protein